MKQRPLLREERRAQSGNSRWVLRHYVVLTLKLFCEKMLLTHYFAINTIHSHHKYKGNYCNHFVDQFNNVLQSQKCTYYIKQYLNMCAQGSHFKLGPILSPRGHLAMSGDIFVCHRMRAAIGFLRSSRHFRWLILQFWHRDENSYLNHKLFKRTPEIRYK